jgi:hypothetical protein
MNNNYKEDWFPNIMERFEVLAREHNLKVGQICSLITGITDKNAYTMTNEELLTELDKIIVKRTSKS